MITESVGGMNVNKLTWKGSDNQVQSVFFSCREVDIVSGTLKIVIFPQLKNLGGRYAVIRRVTMNL